jgi:AP-3 complex subunit sigma
VVDRQESELGILDLIQVFVEALDRVFTNVCELDLVFRPDDVLMVLSEIVSGGLVLQVNLDSIVNSLRPVQSKPKVR